MNKLSGAEKMALLICKNMKEYEPIVLCGGNNLKKVFEESNIKSYSIEFSNKNIIKDIKKIKEIVNKEDIKVIHAHDNTASVISYLSKKIFKLKVKIISHIHSCYPWLKKNGVNKKVDSFLRPKYDYNIVCGNIVYEFYEENAKYFDKEKTIILSNAIDINEINNFNISKIDEVRKKFNIPECKVIIGFIGRLDYEKGIIPFIKELVKHKHKFNDSKFLLVGNGSQEDEVKRLIKENELEELFVLTGFQDNAYSFYPLIDIFFLPSLYEGLPMVLLEAMAFGKAIIATDVGSINEVIKKDTGVLIESCEYEKFINELDKIKDNKKLIKFYSINAKRTVEEKFSIKTYINNVENKLYKSIIK